MMDFNETAEHGMLREAVRKIGLDFGHDYFVEKSKTNGRMSELWSAVARAGFIGVNIPEEYGGGGMGLLELSIVGEELAAAGCPALLMVVSPASWRTVIPMEICAPDKQYTLFFDEVRVPAERLIGAEHEGLRQVFTGLNPERVMGAAQGNGIARYALEKASSYALDRQVWGVPIGMHQGLSHPLAIAKIEVEQARLMTTKAAWL